MAGIAIRTESLSRHFGNLRAVDGLSFEVPTGSIFGFLGPNGAGKTTTFSLLCGFMRPTAGTAEVLGAPLNALHRVRRRMSALPQDARFHPERTVIDDLRFLAHLGGQSPDDASRDAERVLAAVGLEDARNVKGKALSHGMAKRFGIAQAFLGSPELVLLDEPTEGLDPRMAKGIRDLIRSLAGKSTVLVSSHNLAEVEDLCDHAAILDRGRLVTAGSMAALTGSDELLLITLGAPIDAPSRILAGLPSVKSVEASSDGRRLRVRLASPEGQPFEAVVTRVLDALIRSGALIGTVGRGRGLEERFLEVT
jgi:ABC-type multidrug transport system ATPase subunit